MSVVTLGIVGFIEVEEKPSGPDQMYVAPVVGFETVNSNVSPSHNGPLLVIGGAIMPQFVEPAPPV